MLLAIGGCEQPEPPPPPPEIPHGFSATLQVVRDGRLYRFGPFVGYYFRPIEPDDLSRVEFVCFNERGFYASDMPAGAKLFIGGAVLAELEPIEGAIPEDGDHIRPVFFDEAPQAWLENRPKPQDEFVHFHSMHDATGAVFLGYWLRHEGVADFTYDMGGRVDRSSPLWHEVQTGPDRRFPRIIEFDFGSAGSRPAKPVRSVGARASTRSAGIAAPRRSRPSDRRSLGGKTD
jgi:hypothetical protein